MMLLPPTCFSHMQEQEWQVASLQRHSRSAGMAEVASSKPQRATATAVAAAYKPRTNAKAYRSPCSTKEVERQC